jgi:hypothetical protein
MVAATGKTARPLHRRNQQAEAGEGAATTAPGRAGQDKAPRPRADRIALALHLASLVGAFVVLAYIDRRMWFRVDDFDFLTERGLHGATLSIWFPHDVHWTTLPLLLWRAIFVFAKMRTARPYLFALYATHLALAHVLWRLMRSTGTGPYVATSLAALFAVLGAGGEDFLSAFQIAFVAPVLLGWLCVLLLNHDGEAVGRDVAAVVVGIAALMSSGVALTMVAVGGLVALLRRGWQAAAWFVAPCGAVYLLWFGLVGRKANTLVPRQSLEATLLAAPAYILTGLAHSMSAATGSDAFGPLVFLAIAWFAVRRAREARGPAAPVFAGLAGSLVFFVVAAFGRDVFGPTEAERSRYVYIAVALLLPAVGLAVTALLGRRRGAGLAALAVLALVGTWNFGQLLTTRDSFEVVSQASERRLIAAVQIAATQRTFPAGMPIANLGGGSLVPTLGTLEQLSREGDLPTGVRPYPVDFVDVATEIQLELTSSPVFAGAGASVGPGSAGFGSAPANAGCTTSTSLEDGAELQLDVQSPASVLVTPAAGTSTVDIGLVIGGVRGTVTLFPLSSTKPWLDVAAAPADVDLFLQPGATVTTCGQAPPRQGP